MIQIKGREQVLCFVFVKEYSCLVGNMLCLYVELIYCFHFSTNVMVISLECLFFQLLLSKTNFLADLMYLILNMNCIIYS